MFRCCNEYDGHNPTATGAHILRLLHEIKDQLMSEQDSIDADTAAISAMGDKVATVISEIDALKAVLPSTISTAALDAAVAALGSSVDAAVADGAPAPAPTPVPADPTPAPVDPTPVPADPTPPASA